MAEQYSLLKSSEDDLDDVDEEESKQTRSAHNGCLDRFLSKSFSGLPRWYTRLDDSDPLKPEDGFPSWLKWTSIATLTCSIVNIALFILTPDPVVPIPTTFNRYATNLERPNMYIGLESLNETISRAALPDSLPVFPHVFLPISRTEPNRVFPYDWRSRVTFNGVVSPGEPHVVLSPDISMIMQVRVHDYNMERCTIAADIPTIESLQPQQRLLHLKGNTSAVEIWSLDIDRELDPKQLSWNSRPPRKDLIDILQVEEGHFTETTEFNCGRSGSLRTFEFACSPDAGECHVEFWQEQPEKRPRLAFLLMQKPSV